MCGIFFINCFFLSACDPGYYSYNCAKKCGYCSNIACDATDGTCSGSCSPGYLGTACKQGKICNKICNMSLCVRIISQTKSVVTVVI